MRIVCPNCEAQYEVPDEVVPPEGRDVQCSSCGQTWFQEHPDYPNDSADDYAADAAMPEPEPLLDEDDPAEDEEFYDTAADTPPRREMDPQVEEILREEGAREAAVRAAERTRSNIETQPDLGLEERLDQAQEDAQIQQMSDRVARMRGIKDQAAAGMADAAESIAEKTDEASEYASESAAAAAAALSARKDLLPDIEEINSTLRSTSDRDVAGSDIDPEAPVRHRKKRSFRRGLLFAVLLFVLALLIYLFATQIAAAVPQVDPLLSTYVTWVDGLRGSLDQQMQAVLQWLDAKAAESDA